MLFFKSQYFHFLLWCMCPPSKLVDESPTSPSFVVSHFNIPLTCSSSPSQSSISHGSCSTTVVHLLESPFIDPPKKLFLYVIPPCKQSLPTTLKSISHLFPQHLTHLLTSPLVFPQWCHPMQTCSCSNIFKPKEFLDFYVDSKHPPPISNELRIATQALNNDLKV